MKMEMKFPIRYLVILMIVVLLMVVPAVLLLKNGVDQFVINGFKNSVDQYNRVFEKSILSTQNALENDIMMFATHPLVQSADASVTNYLNNKIYAKQMTPSRNGGTEQQIYNLFEQYGKNHPNVIYVYLATKHGGYILWPESKVSQRYDPRTRPWYKAAYEDPDAITQTAPYKDLITGELDFSNVKAVYDASGEPLGVVGIDMAYGGLASAINELKMNQDRSFMLVHQTGYILLDTKFKQYESQVIDQVKNPDLKALFFENGIKEIDIDQQHLIAHSTSLLGGKWHLMTFIRKEVLFRQSNQVVQTMFFAGAGIVLTIVLMIGGGGYLFYYNSRLQHLIQNRTQELQVMVDGLIDKEQTVRESEERYKALVDNIPGIVYRCQPGAPWRMVHISSEVEVLTGFSVEDFLKKDGVTWADIIHPEDIELVETSTESMTDSFFQMIYRIYHRDGSLKWVFERGRRVNDHLGDAYMDGVIFDYTERMDSESELKRLKEDLESRVEARTAELKTAMTQLIEQEKMASLGGIVSGVAHEVNTPLGIGVTIASYIDKMTHENIELFKTGQLTKNQLMAYFDNVVESSELLKGNLSRAAELVSSFKQISVNQSIDEMTLFKPDEYLQMVITSLKHEYKNTKHTVEIICPNRFEVFSYPGAYSQIFTNFIMNSLIHGFKGIDEGRITIEIERKKDRYRMVYRDNGVGITTEHLQKVFEPFFTTNRQNGGSGLGLHIVYKLVTQKLEGKLECQSEAGQGVMFALDLPLHLTKSVEDHLS